MNYEHIKYLLRSKTVQAFHYDLLPFALTVLHREFKAKVGVPLSVDYLDFRNNVDSMLQFLRSSEEKITGLSDSAEELIKTWEKMSLLRIDQRGTGYEVKLTMESERLFEWLLSLEQRRVIASESKFLTLQNLVVEVISGSLEDYQAQIKAIEEQIDALIERKDRIDKARAVEPYSDTLLAGRLQDIEELCRLLVIDMTRYLTEFEQLAESLMEESLSLSISRGKLLGDTIDAVELIRNSPAGKSFYAFRDLLIEERTEQLQVMLDEIVQGRWASLVQQSDVLRDLMPTLIVGMRRTVETNHGLIEHLHYMLEAGRVRERIVTQELTRKIKRLGLGAVKLGAADPQRKIFFYVPGEVKANLQMDRPWFIPPDEVEITGKAEVSTFEVDDEMFFRVANAFRIDLERVRRNIMDALEYKPCVSLEEIVRYSPIEQGVSELYTYFSIPLLEIEREVDATRNEIILVCRYEANQVIERLFRVPVLLFRRKADAY